METEKNAILLQYFFSKIQGSKLNQRQNSKHLKEFLRKYNLKAYVQNTVSVERLFFRRAEPESFDQNDM